MAALEPNQNYLLAVNVFKWPAQAPDPKEDKLDSEMTLARDEVSEKIKLALNSQIPSQSLTQCCLSMVEKLDQKNGVKTFELINRANVEEKAMISRIYHRVKLLPMFQHIDEEVLKAATLLFGIQRVSLIAAGIFNAPLVNVELERLKKLRQTNKEKLDKLQVIGPVRTQLVEFLKSLDEQIARLEKSTF